MGISFDTVEDNRKFAQKYNFNFLLLSDRDRKVGALYGALRDPSNPRMGNAKRISYLIDREGNIQRAWPKVSPADHPAEVLAAIQ